MAKKKKTTKKKELINIKAIKIFFRDDRVRFLLALLTFFFAAVLLLAFISYLFTWQTDQSKLDIDTSNYIGDTEIAVENWAGKFGAVVSNLFIHHWFGLASFGFLFLLFIFSFYIIEIELLPLKKTIKYTLMAIAWFSITFSYLFGDAYFFLGGSYGYFITRWIDSVIGKVGTGALLFTVLAGFIFYVYPRAFAYVKAIFGNAGSYKENLRCEMVKIPETEKQPFAFKKKTPAAASTASTSVNKQNNLSEHKVIDMDTNEELRPVDENKMKKEKDAVVKKQEFILKDNGKQQSLFSSDFEIENTKSTSSESEDSQENEEAENNQSESKDEQHISFEDIQNGNQKTEENPENKSADDLAFKVQKNEDITAVGNLNTPYDPTLDLGSFKFPTVELLEEHKSENCEVTNEELISNKNKIVETLKNYKIEITKIKATIGPTVTLYEIIPAPGVRISKIKNLEDDIALSLAALGIRIIAPMPGRGTIGIEVPNQNPEIVSMKSVMQSKKFQTAKMQLPVAIGKTISNETYVFDLTKMPHLLVAGATGQGKSVGLNAILTSLLYKKHPAELKFVLVDPKKVELTLYENIEKHYLAKLPDSEEAIITENQKVIHTLNSLNIEMDNRYQMLKKAQVRNIKEYNAKFRARQLNPENGHEFLPYIVLVIDEFADLIMTAGKEIELPIARIAQLARAIGIHLIVATQRPSTNIITGMIKANFPARIAFKVASMIDSRTILDSPGANQLIGRGDMLITKGSDLVRVQCAFIDTPELDRITKWIGEQQGYPSAFYLPDYQTEDDEPGSVDLSKKDDLFDDAARIIVMNQQGSTSLIQRKMSIGYNRAGRIVDQLEAAGIVGPSEGSKARQVLISDEYSLEQLLNSLNEK